MSESLINQVKSKYGAVAASNLSSDQAGVRAVAQAFGYSPEELASLPAEANMGLSCGNPTATANLRPGEVVVDLGCGGGLDVLLAAPKVGPTGKAIGIDMTPEMIERARLNAARAGVTNVEFLLATIDRLPLADNSVDCLISNCVINLAPDKPAVFREMFRVLKPGGRVAVSDIALKKPLPPEISRDLLAYVGCIAGAVLTADYEHMLRAAGFQAVQILDTHKDLNAYSQVENGSGCCSSPSGQAGNLPVTGSCCGPANPGSTPDLHRGLTDLLSRYNVNEYAASVQVFALKAEASGSGTAGERKAQARSTLQVYDPPMCCPTGVCGPKVDPTLPRFAADLEWLKSQGVTVERFNLAQQPAAFTGHPEVKATLVAEGTRCLPLIFVDGRLVSRGVYPSRQMLAACTGVKLEMSLPVAGCCSTRGCC